MRPDEGNEHEDNEKQHNTGTDVICVFFLSYQRFFHAMVIIENVVSFAILCDAKVLDPIIAFDNYTVMF